MRSRSSLCRGGPYGLLQDAGLQIVVRNTEAAMREVIENAYRQSGLELHAQRFQ